MPDPLLLNGDRPLVLFPVRLETRFFGQELRIRVFPDKIHVDTHEPELTADEVEWGKHFHTLLWNATTEEARKDAWRQLADRYGAERASWIVRQLTPTNPAERPAKPPKFPSPPVRPEAQKNETWTRAPRTAVLPDQWIATAFVQGTGAVTVAGNLIPDILPVGPNPQATVVQDDETLAIDDGMKWMVDFNEAERLGMAVRLPLPATAGPPRINLLLVFGVKRSLDSAASATRLRELIEAHKYTDGLSLVTQGTPTNNTEDATSGFTTDDPGHDQSFRLILGEPQFQAGDGSDGDELSKALGLPPELLARTGNADAREQREARDMNRALWPSTWGYYLEQMMGLGDFNGQQPGAFPEAEIDANLEWAQQHFVDHVRAGGPLPTLRAGKQPYGILPVTALDLWGATPEDGKLASRDAAVVALVRRLQDYWSDESRTAPRMGNHTDPDIDFAEVFAMDGLSTSYAIRNIFGLFYTQELFEFLRTPPERRVEPRATGAGDPGVGVHRRPSRRHAARGADVVRSRAFRAEPAVGSVVLERRLHLQLHRSVVEGAESRRIAPACFHSGSIQFDVSAVASFDDGRVRECRGSSAGARAASARRAGACPIHATADGNAARSHYGGSTAHRTGVHATGRQERAGFPQESRGAEGVEDRQAVHVDARHSRSVVASPGRLGHIVCNEALEDHAAERSCRRVSGRLRLGRRPATWAATNGGDAAACRTGTRFRISERSRLCPCAVARSCRDGGGAAKRASHPFWPHARSTGRSACDRSVLRSRPHGAISAGWCAIRPAARRLAGVSLRARPARAWAGRLHRCVPPHRADQIERASTRPGKRSSPCRRPTWWMGSTSCAERKSRRIASLFSSSPARWRKFRCRPS